MASNPSNLPAPESEAPKSVTPQGGAPSSGTSSNLPATTRPGLDRRAVERVLARAAELQGLGGAQVETDLIDEPRLLEIAREAGLDETSVRQALAEERTRIGPVDEGRTWHERVSGPAIVSASRTIPGTPDDILRVLDSWMQRDECLQVQRRFTDRVVWEARTDWFGALKRGLRIGGRAYHLARARQVAATVVPVDDRRSVVRLDADMSSNRTSLVRLASVSGGSGVIAGGTIVAIGAVAHVAALALATAAAPVAIGGAGAYLILRKHRDFAQRMMLALEQVLDRLEYGDVRRPTPLLDALTAPRPQYR